MYLFTYVAKKRHIHIIQYHFTIYLQYKGTSLQSQSMFDLIFFLFHLFIFSRLSSPLSFLFVRSFIRFFFYRKDGKEQSDPFSFLSINQQTGCSSKVTRNVNID